MFVIVYTLPLGYKGDLGKVINFLPANSLHSGGVRNYTANKQILKIIKDKHPHANV